jgi:hypothetical protein
MEDKWKTKMAAEDRKSKAEESRVALEEHKIAKEKEAEERSIMFMNPNNMDDTARREDFLSRRPYLGC